MDYFIYCNFSKHELLRSLIMVNCNTETCRRCFNVNSNLHFNIIFLDNSLVHQLVNKSNFDNIKVHGTNVKTILYMFQTNLFINCSNYIVLAARHS